MKYCNGEDLTKFWVFKRPGKWMVLHPVPKRQGLPYSKGFDTFSEALDYLRGLGV